MHPDAEDPATSARRDTLPHEAAAPRSRRERILLVWIRLADRVNLGVATAYLGAISLVGFEGLAIVLVFSSMWPVGIPLVVGGLALVFFTRERIRAFWQRLRADDQSR